MICFYSSISKYNYENKSGFPSIQIISSVCICMCVCVLIANHFCCAPFDCFKFIGFDSIFYCNRFSCLRNQFLPLSHIYSQCSFSYRSPNPLFHFVPPVHHVLNYAHFYCVHLLHGTVFVNLSVYIIII